MKHAEAMQLVSAFITPEMLTVTNLTTNARMWSALRGERPSFYGLNMGLCLPFAVGLSLAFPKRRVFAFDGDGSLIIETSALITAAEVSPPNLLAVVFDNGRYSDMAVTATTRRTDLELMARGAGIPRTATVRTPDELNGAVEAALASGEFTLLVAKVEAQRDNPFRGQGDYIVRSERGMKEAFVETLRHLPDYGSWR
ncbi:MAG TPA: thiamine pyrophosphate-dependent enzyme [Chloroflexota bacterium]|nr:thiamine pyrophosphate-dependent enzyme [Chloroflexota bacterium]